MPKYIIQSPLQRDGKLRTKGPVEMPAKDAAPLLKVGVLREPGPADVDGPGHEHPDAGLSERELAVRAAVGELLATDPDQADPALWTKAKRPDLKAIRKHPELKDATRQEVDAAFDVVKG